MLTKNLTWLLLALLLVGCSQSLYMQGRRHLEKGDFDPAIAAFYQEISVNPTSVRAWRELGVAFYEKGDLAKADDALKQANQIAPDARTHLYFGLTYEQQEEYNKALDAYTLSLSLKPGGKTASLIRSHLDRLVMRKLERDAALAVENESAIDADTIPANTVAVTNFDGSSLSAELAPLARGLAELTSIDLAKVSALTVVERAKLDLLLRELEMGVSGVVDPATAPRLGLLMGSRKLITGTVLSIGEDGLKLDAAVVSTIDSTTLRPEGVEGELTKFFHVQKQLVFNILQELGIKLSAEERDAIEEIPTESFLAFMAYSRGLEYLSRGPQWYGAAEREFKNAVEHDGNFQPAREQANTVTQLMNEGGYEQSYSRFETTVRQESDQGVVSSGGTEGALTALAGNLGIIPGQTDPPPADELPVTDQTVSLRIKGDLDAR